jgi:hypothetical protein
MLETISRGLRESVVNTTDDFYIGWQSQAPKSIRSHVRKTVLFLLLIVPVLSVVLVLAQRTIGKAVFEWGTIKTFSGVLRTQPYPHLLVARPGEASSAFSAYYLVAPFKVGLKPEALAAFDGKQVSLKGTLIYRGNQTMIEARPGSLQPAPEAAQLKALIAAYHRESLGRQTLVGEIVDSKCYLGVMNPGQLTPHRACAVRCISGGIPPVLLVRPKTGPPLYFLLVSSDGRAVNKRVLDMVAEPVQITGDVERQGELLMLRADPQTFHRVPK